MSADPKQIAAGLSEAQLNALARVCRTNGGGVAIRCKVGDDGYGVPTDPTFKALWKRDLIQGKAGAYEKVVHTRLGLEVHRILQGENK